jgi:hypothetical protein
MLLSVFLLYDNIFHISEEELGKVITIKEIMEQNISLKRGQ